jgi:hypothetical protein
MLLAASQHTLRETESLIQRFLNLVESPGTNRGGLWREADMANPNDAGEAYRYSLVEIPTKIAWSIIVGALIGAFVLYVWAGKSFADYIAKLADLLIQGAILTILFASLAKGIVVTLTRR